MEADKSSHMTVSTTSGEATGVSSLGNQVTSLPVAPPKKKRNLPGMPDPDAEVIALSPKSLLATNRFVCEICSKGFQRDQNLQLHRRGHNLQEVLDSFTNTEFWYSFNQLLDSLPNSIGGMISLEQLNVAHNSTTRGIVCLIGHFI